MSVVRCPWFSVAPGIPVNGARCAVPIDDPNANLSPTSSRSQANASAITGMAWSTGRVGVTRRSGLDANMLPCWHRCGCGCISARRIRSAPHGIPHAVLGLRAHTAAIQCHCMVPMTRNWIGIWVWQQVARQVARTQTRWARLPAGAVTVPCRDASCRRRTLRLRIRQGTPMSLIRARRWR